MFIFFFFQAEDGIRDLVRSRGLGDVYKRQGRIGQSRHPRDYDACARDRDDRKDALRVSVRTVGNNSVSVSYTHLTLPTSDLV